MTKDEALDVLAGMMHLRFFPTHPAAVNALADLLIKLTKGDRDRAEWLVRECADSFDDYPGPKTLKEIYYGEYPAAGSPQVEYRAPGSDEERRSWREQWERENAGALDRENIAGPQLLKSLPAPAVKRIQTREFESES